MGFIYSVQIYLTVHWNTLDKVKPFEKNGSSGLDARLYPVYFLSSRITCEKRREDYKHSINMYSIWSFDLSSSLGLNLQPQLEYYDLLHSSSGFFER